jgi:ketosteroid isomerase-like protein
MGTREDVDLVRRGYEAFGAGDMDTLRGLFAEDAVWHLGGSILAYFGELFTRSDGTIKVDLDDLIGGENHTVGFQRVHAQRNGAAIDQRTVIVFALKDGKVSEVYEFPEDTAKAADFWS